MLLTRFSEGVSAVTYELGGRIYVTWGALLTVWDGILISCLYMNLCLFTHFLIFFSVVGT